MSRLRWIVGGVGADAVAVTAEEARYLIGVHDPQELVGVHLAGG